MKAKQAALSKGKCLVRHKRSEAVFLLSSHRVAQELSRGISGWPMRFSCRQNGEARVRRHSEDMANRDFEMGAKYGNEVAAEMARRTNVYQKAW